MNDARDNGQMLSPATVPRDMTDAAGLRLDEIQVVLPTELVCLLFLGEEERSRVRLASRSHNQRACDYSSR